MPARPLGTETSQETPGDGASPRQAVAATLRLVDVRRDFGAVTAVDGVSLDIQPGELVSLPGPSGSPVRPADSDAALRISAPPAQIFEVGSPVWLRIDPRQMAAVE